MKIVFISFLALLLLSGGCAAPAARESAPPAASQSPTVDQLTAPKPEAPEAKTDLKGVSLSPKSFTGADFASFFTEAAQAGQIVTWAGDWLEMAAENGGPGTVTQLAATYGYTPLVEVAVHSDGTLNRPLNEENRQLYRESTLAFVRQYRPRYLGIGIEMNTLYEKDPDDYGLFVAFYNGLYAAIKQISPDTKVFTIFQLEEMKGYTFWSTDPPDTAKAEWPLLDQVETDLAAFTTYPGLVFKDPVDIPPDYYTEILSHTSKPIAFTEMGWHSTAGPPGWESSEAEQKRFVERFFSLTAAVKPEIIIWSFLYDQPTFAPFDSMGLKRAEGTPRPAWEAWLAAEAVAD